MQALNAALFVAAECCFTTALRRSSRVSFLKHECVCAYMNTTIWIISWINSHWNDWGSLKSYQQKYCFYLNRLIISQWNPWNLCLEMLLIDLISYHSARIIWIATRPGSDMQSTKICPFTKLWYSIQMVREYAQVQGLGSYFLARLSIKLLELDS